MLFPDDGTFNLCQQVTKKKVRVGGGGGGGVQQSACSDKVQAQFQCPVFCAEYIGNCVIYLDQWLTQIAGACHRDY